MIDIEENNGKQLKVSVNQSSEGNRADKDDNDEFDDVDLLWKLSMG